MSLGTNKELAENKLILLYIIDTVKAPINNFQITKMILDLRFMNYFMLQQFLSDLCGNGLLHSESAENRIFYSITDKGIQTLAYFKHLIPAGIRNRIDSILPDARKEIKQELQVIADYMADSETKFYVHCSVREQDFSLVDIELTVGTKNDALFVCENWKKNSDAIYAEIIESLLRERNQ